jgi:hypothetical protein
MVECLGLDCACTRLSGGCSGLRGYLHLISPRGYLLLGCCTMLKGDAALVIGMV